MPHGDDRPIDAAGLVRWMGGTPEADPVKIHLGGDIPEAPGPVKAIPVRWFCGERVRLIGGEPGEFGFVVGHLCRPSGVLYQVSWPGTKSTTDHWPFEIEDAD